MAWQLNPALTRFRNAVNAAYPNRDKASDGTIGDLAHQSTSSDHNPDSDGSVDAWDMDVDLGTADNPAAIERLKALFEGHESSRYWIHNRQIASRSDGWIRRPYDGANPHDKHVHWNTREAYENSTAPWNVTPEGVARMFCKHGDRGQNVKYLQYRLHNLGFPLGAVDGIWGDATTGALKKAMAALGVTDDGLTYGPEEMIRLDVLWGRKYAGADVTALDQRLDTAEAAIKTLQSAPAGGFTLPAQVTITGTLSQ